MIYRYKDYVPQIDESVFIADGAKIIGNVIIEAETSIWFNTVLRGDEGLIKIGKHCSIQDNAVCHLYEQYPLIIEDEVTIGHSAIIHGCTLKKGVLVGMGATILDGAIIGERTIIGANTLIPSGIHIPPNSLVLGNPGKIVSQLTKRHDEMLKQTTKTYVKNNQDYQNPHIFERID